MSLGLFAGASSGSLLNDNGSAMPGFTFEKISPPDPRKPAVSPATNERPRGPVVRMLERFVEMRTKRKLRVGNAGKNKD
jgi:hypothetical protein